MKNADNINLDKLIGRQNLKIVSIDWRKAGGWFIFKPLTLIALWFFQFGILIHYEFQTKLLLYLAGIWIFILLYFRQPEDFSDITKKAIIGKIQIPIIEKNKKGILVANQENSTQLISWRKVALIIDKDVPRDTLQISGDFSSPKIILFIPRYQKK